MQDLNSLLNYFLEVNAAKGEGFADTEIDAHIKTFCELVQAQINHPFSDGGPEFDADSNRGKAWRDGSGAHVSYRAYIDNGVLYAFRVRSENLTEHGSVMTTFNTSRKIDVGIQFLLAAAIVDLKDEASIKRVFNDMRNILKQTSGVKLVLEYLGEKDVWEYLVPNIVITKEEK